MRKKWVVYVHKNKTTGKCYVGQTCQKPKDRWENGKGYTEYDSPKFSGAIKKYGWEDFEHIILAECDTLEKAYELEQHYIKEFDSFKNGYNCTLGGQGSIGKTMSKSTKEKISNANKGHPSWIKSAPKEKLPMYGKHHSEESKRKIGNANRGRVISLEGRKRMSLAKLGKKGTKRSEETKRKLSLGKIGSKNPMYGKHTNNRPNLGVIVLQYDLQGNLLNEFKSIEEAQRQTGVSQIGRAIKNNKKARGYIWKRKN